jgi:hypothetical protein
VIQNPALGREHQFALTMMEIPFGSDLYRMDVIQSIGQNPDRRAEESFVITVAILERHAVLLDAAQDKGFLFFARLHFSTLISNFRLLTCLSLSLPQPTHLLFFFYPLVIPFSGNHDTRSGRKKKYIRND